MSVSQNRRNRMYSFHSILYLLFGVLLSVPLHAQTTGALTGIVADPSRAAIAGASVTAIQQDTGLIVRTVSGSAGVYRFPILQPGTYAISVMKSGFEKAQAQATVVVSETATLNVVLPPGDVQTTVTVMAGQVAMLQTDSSSLGRVVDERTVQQLPLATRNFTQLMTLSPGVSATVNNATALGRGTPVIYANGARAISNSLTIDGIDADNIHSNSLAENNYSSNGSPIPSPEAIEEFKVQTGLYDAQFGRNSGANTSLVTKSGTDHFHGSVYEFFRNDALNANTFLFRQTGTRRAALKQNQYGAAVGGPLYGKTFFFASYQGTRQINGISGSTTLSLPQGLYGSDRSAASLGAVYAGQTGIHGGLAIAANGSNLSPVALALLNDKFPNGSYVIPGPTINTATNNYSISVPSRYQEDQGLFNINHDFGSTDHLAGKVFIVDQPQFRAFTTASVPGFGQTQLFNSREFNIDEVHILSSTLVNDARVGFFRITGALTDQNDINIASIGMNRFNSSVFTNIPLIALSGGTGTFSVGYNVDGNQGGSQNTYQYTDTLSKVLGRHSLRFGGDFRRYQDNYYSFNRTLGTLSVYSFTDFLIGRAAGPVASGGNGITTYSAFSDSSVSTTSGHRNDRLSDYDLYFQDDWKATPNLTLNVGLRWDRFGLGVDRYGRDGNFVPSLYTAPPPGGSTSAGFVQSSNAVTPLSGLPSVNPRLLNHELWKNFAPRVGFSYQVSPKVAIRGGYGIFFDRLSNQISLRTALAPPNYVKTDFTSSNASSFSLVNPFSVLPLPSKLPVLPLLNDPFTFPVTSLIATNAVATNLNTPYTHQFVTSVQWQVLNSTLLDIGYIGTKGVKLSTQDYANQPALASAATPVNGVTTNTSANTSLRVPFLGMTPTGLTYLTDSADSTYNSLQISATKRLTKGLQFLISYTYSHSIDDTSGDTSSDFVNWSGDQTNIHQATGSSDFDRTHRFIASYIYDLPFLVPGLTHNRFTQTAFGGWEIAGVTTLQTGSPFNVTDANGALYYGTGTSRANYAPGASAASAVKTGPVTNRYQSWFNTSAFVTAGNLYGNVGRNVLRGPNQTNWDVSAIKTFPIYREAHLQFRTEFFNVFNHTTFGNPGSAVSSGTSFGVISTLVGNPRIIQFAAKILF